MYGSGVATKTLKNPQNGIKEVVLTFVTPKCATDSKSEVYHLPPKKPHLCMLALGELEAFNPILIALDTMKENFKNPHL